MRAMRKYCSTTLMALLLGAGSVAPLSSWAAPLVPAQSTQLATNQSVSLQLEAKTRQSHMVGLGDLQSIGVYDVEPYDFSATRENVPPELIEYARTALESKSEFHYQSPAQGVLHFRCDNSSCSRVRAEVTEGLHGPVVWQTVRQYRRCPLVEMRFLPDAKRFANEIVESLSQDYLKSVKAVPVKIQIKED